MPSFMDPKRMVEYCRIPMEELKDHPEARCKIEIFKKSKEVGERAGQMMIEELLANKKAGKPTRWVMACGAKTQYNVFIDYVNKNRIPLDDVHIFLMDDYLDWNCRPFPPDNPYFNLPAKFKRDFYDKIDPELNVPESQRHVPLYNDQDALDKAVEAVGGVDTVFGGLGFKGLVAYCEAPMNPYFTVTIDDYCNMKTRIYPINDDTTIAYAERKFGGLTHMNPPLGISIGFKSMLTAKRVVFSVTTGLWKRTAVRVMMFNEPTVEYPSTIFTDHCEVVLLCDEDSAQPPLPERFKPEYYNFQITGEL